MDTTTLVTVEWAEKVLDRIYELGGDVDDYDIRPEYIGRGRMHPILAIVGYEADQRFVWMAIGQLMDENEIPAQASRWFGSIDNIGAGWVIY